MNPAILFEDEHLLAVCKPSGWNTHSPSPFGGEGLYEWLKNREPRFAGLAILHRLDKETSGVIVFGKSAEANRSLAAQFGGRTIQKKYVFLTDRPPPAKELSVRSALVRTGEKYVSRPVHPGGVTAETIFRVLDQTGGKYRVEARPLTGRTHQIRVHAAAKGFPIFGDTLYGGTPAFRLCLHAAVLRLRHPVSDAVMEWCAPEDFDAEPGRTLRSFVIDGTQTDIFRLIHGTGDGHPGWHVDRFGGFLLSQSETPLDQQRLKHLRHLLDVESLRGAFHKTLARKVGVTPPEQLAPVPLFDTAPPEEIIAKENGVCFSIRFREGYSVGLFPDQRDNRRRLLTGYVSPGFSLSASAEKPLAGLRVLNTFAYTCGFSVCAAKAGAKTVSLDLSPKYLEWGRHHFTLNGLNPGEHEFIHGDVFDWMRRLAKKGRTFDLILLDPPTFSRSKEYGVFRVEKNYPELVSAALHLLKDNGVIFASANTAGMETGRFLAGVRGAVTSAHRTILREHYAPQPPDFPVTRDEPAYLKTIWLRIGKPA